MTIHAFSATIEMVLGRNRREVEAANQLRGRGARRFDFDGYWTGDNWVSGKVKIYDATPMSE